jgi:hypothetical protein
MEQHHWVTCYRFSVYLSIYVFCGLLLENFDHLRLNHSFVSKRSENNYPLTWHHTPEEHIPQLEGCKSLKTPTFYFFLIGLCILYLRTVPYKGLILLHFARLCPVVEVCLRFLMKFTAHRRLEVSAVHRGLTK